jgi:curli biogenesis system outer membrane secretion channel CsgG
MFKNKLILILPVIFLLLHGCATMEKPEVKAIDLAPQISKTSQPTLSGKTGLKRKVAIARFSNETRYGQSFFLDQNQDRIGKQAVDILSARLLETDKFILLERTDLDKINQELKQGDVTPLKNMADYLIVGSVTEFGRKDTGETGIFSRTKKQTVFAKVHIRLLDVYSGQILYSEEGEGEAFSEAGTVFGVGGRAGYDSTLNDKALEAAITNLSSNVIENLLDKPWRSYLLGYEDDYLIMAGGKHQNIKSGEVFQVQLKGKSVKNPQTNMNMTLPPKKLARIKVVSFSGDQPENEISLCEIVSGNLSSYIRAKDFSKLYVTVTK